MFRTPEEMQSRFDAEIEAGKKLGHTQIMEGVTMDDTCVCSCGWKSNTYWDGVEFAHAEWVKHIQSEGAEITYPKSPS